MIRVAVAGAAGRMGQSVCRAVEGADDLELTGRADPELGTAVADVLGAADVLVDFTVPDQALDNVLACLDAGVHAVVGTSGWDVDAARARAQGSEAKVLFCPNFAVGAVLMMRFAAEASKLMAKAEIVELHHDRKLDAPSGTAARTAEMMEGEVPIHSVRLPGLVAHQEVVLGDVGQTLTIRHDSIDRESFMPGVLIACRRVGELPDPVTVGHSTCCGRRRPDRGHRPRGRPLPPARARDARPQGRDHGARRTRVAGRELQARPAGAARDRRRARPRGPAARLRLPARPPAGRARRRDAVGEGGGLAGASAVHRRPRPVGSAPSCADCRRPSPSPS
jgi:4-hydroxy-tetrahydrodipicolinate reductase